MRSYSWIAHRPGGFMFYPDKYCDSQLRIRAVVCIMFRKYFGHPATEYWHKDGFMAEAKDRRGNCIEVSQLNRDMTPIALLPAHEEK